MGHPEKERVINLLGIDGLSTAMTCTLSGMQQLPIDSVTSYFLFIPPLRTTQTSYLQTHIWLKNYLPGIGNVLTLKEDSPSGTLNE